MSSTPNSGWLISRETLRQISVSDLENMRSGLVVEVQSVDGIRRIYSEDDFINPVHDLGCEGL